MAAVAVMDEEMAREAAIGVVGIEEDGGEGNNAKCGER